MSVAHDASSASATSVSEASFNWSHNPVGTPKGVLIFVITVGSSTQHVSSVTYAGTTVPAVSGGAAADTATEPGRCDTYFLGASVPTNDPATVVVNRTNNATPMWACAITVTANSQKTEVYTAGIVLLQEDGSYAEQSVSDNRTSGQPDSVRYGGGYSAHNTAPSTGSNSTSLQFVESGGASARIVRETTAGVGSRSVGISATSEDRAGVHLAVREEIFFGALSLTETVSRTIAGKSTRFASAALPLTVTEGVIGRIGKIGTTTLTLTASAAVAGSTGQPNYEELPNPWKNLAYVGDLIDAIQAALAGSLVWKGDYTSGTIYYPGAVVRDGGTIYLCIAQTADSPPTASWQAL